MSKIKVNSIEAATGSTITIPSGQTLDISSTTLTLPSTIVTTTGTQTLTNKTIGVSQLTGTLPVANGGTGLTSLGSASQVLRVNSGATALEFATASSDFVRLSTVTISSAVSSVNFDSSIVSGYLYYQVRFCNIGVSNDGDDIGIRLSTDNGSTFATTQAMRAYSQELNNSASFDVSSQGAFTYHLLAEDAEATESTDGTSGGIIDIFGANSSNHKHMISHAYTRNQNGGYYTYWTVSRVQTTTAINYISLYNLNNNLDAGTVTLYGVKNS